MPNLELWLLVPMVLSSPLQSPFLPQLSQHGPQGRAHILTEVWQVLTGDHNKLSRLWVSGKLVGRRESSPHGRGEAWSHALVQRRVTKSWKKKHHSSQLRGCRQLLPVQEVIYHLIAQKDLLPFPL